MGSLGSLRMTHTLRYTIEINNHRESVLERLPRLPKGAEVSGGELEASADLGSLGSLRMTHTLRYTIEINNHRESVLERLPRLPKERRLMGNLWGSP